MKFIKAPLEGPFVIELEKREDERGFFARTWDKDIFAQHGIYREPVQTNMSVSLRRGTIRGMHYQIAPYEESKLIRCVSGAIYDVIIDMRKDSPTRKQWFGVELSDENNKMLFVPEGFAHGFLTLKDNTQVSYQVSAFYNFESERIIRYNDPMFKIEWPIEVSVLSEKDKNYPDFVE